MPELVENPGEGAHGGVAEAGAVRVAAGARGAQAEEVGVARVARRAPGADAVRVEVAAVADVDPVQHRFCPAAALEDPQAVEQAAAILAVGHRDDQVPASGRGRVCEGDEHRVVDK